MGSRLNAYLLWTQAIKRSLVTAWSLQHPTAEASYPTNAASRPHNRDPIMRGRTATVHLRCIGRTRGCMQVYNSRRRYAAKTPERTYTSTLPEQPQPRNRICIACWDGIVYHIQQIIPISRSRLSSTAPTIKAHQNRRSQIVYKTILYAYYSGAASTHTTPLQDNTHLIPFTTANLTITIIYTM